MFTIPRLMAIPIVLNREREGRLLQNKWLQLAILLSLLLSTLIVWSLRPRISISNVSAIETSGTFGVYWDSNCTTRVTSINWGNMMPGQEKTTPFYIRNEASSPMFLAGIDKNWNPTTAQSYIHFTFDSEDQKIQAGETKKVTCTLTVSVGITNISNFSFDILLLGTDYLLADVNKDGRVDMRDTNMLMHLFGTTPTSPNWNPDADLNKDLIVGMRDIFIALQDFGKTSS
jgi:hypothetical protein